MITVVFVPIDLSGTIAEASYRKTSTIGVLGDLDSMSNPEIEELISRSEQLNRQIIALTAEKKKLDNKILSLKIISSIKETEEKASTKSLNYLLFRQFVVMHLRKNPKLGVKPMQIKELYEDSGKKINHNTLRGYLSRMSNDGWLANERGHWFLAQKEKAGESWRSRPPGIS